MRTMGLLLAVISTLLLAAGPAKAKKPPEYSVEASVEALDEEAIAVSLEIQRDTPDKGWVVIHRHSYNLARGKSSSSATKDYTTGRRIEMRIRRNREVANHVLVIVRILDEGELVFSDEQNLPVS